MRSHASINSGVAVETEKPVGIAAVPMSPISATNAAIIAGSSARLTARYGWSGPCDRISPVAGTSTGTMK
jgi:hypothetical protein